MFYVVFVPREVWEMTKSTPTTTSQTNDLIRWMQKNDPAARAARFLLQSIFSR